MFCTTKKTMLCMKCFRDTSMDARLHCVDLDTAYNQGAKKLERALMVSRGGGAITLAYFKETSVFWKLYFCLNLKPKSPES